MPIDINHLYYDGKHYDARYREHVADLDFWLRQAARYPGDILELACGTGRVAIPLARQGARVTGVDLSDSMLAEAERKRAAAGVALELVKADISRFNLGRQFGLVLFPASSIVNLLTPEDIDGCLACARAHLAPGGRFILEVFNPRLEQLVPDAGRRRLRFSYPSPDGSGMVEVYSTSHYDRARQLEETVLFYRLPHQAEEVVVRRPARIFFPQEVDVLLRHSGFTVEAKLGGYDGEAFGSDSAVQLCVCR